MSDDDMLLWLDLETTGPDEAKDSIIEVGCILTDPDLNEVAAGGWLVLPTDEALGRMVRNQAVREMHEANGLLSQVLAGEGSSPDTVARDMLRWLRWFGAPEGATVLCGSGVGHFDRRFLARWMPQVDRYLRYWCIDVGVLRRSYALWTGDVLSDANGVKTHRALDDARCHLAEARRFRAFFRERCRRAGEGPIDDGPEAA